jgi:hypothetical protein
MPRACARLVCLSVFVLGACSSSTPSNDGGAGALAGGARAGGGGSGAGSSGTAASAGKAASSGGSSAGGSGGRASGGGRSAGGSGSGAFAGRGGTGATDAGAGGAAVAGGRGGSAGTAGSDAGEAGTGGGSGGDEPLPGDGPITLVGPEVQVGGKTLHLRGVNWNPIPKGGTHPGSLDYDGFAATDIPLMQAAGINAIRTYEPLTDRGVLDALAAAGIFVLNTVYPYGGNAASTVDAPVNAVKDHAAILFWVIGNEWNYNGLYVDLSAAESIERINEVMGRIRALDTAHPIATVYGELPSADVLSQLEDIDVWGLNVYSGISFGNRFDDWSARSDKPMFFGEYGADAWNASTGEYDPESQAMATEALTTEILEQSTRAGGPCSGGTIFEFADEWWKDQGGSADEQDVGGIAPGGGPYPDSTFNEEYWGIVTVEREPRPAYEALKRLYSR